MTVPVGHLQVGDVVQVAGTAYRVVELRSVAGHTRRRLTLHDGNTLTYPTAHRVEISRTYDSHTAANRHQQHRQTGRNLPR